MEELPTGRDLEDFIIKNAEIFEKDREVVSLLKHQYEIAFDDPVRGSQIQAELNFLIRDYSDKNNIDKRLFGPLNLSHDLIAQKNEGVIQDYYSEQTRSYIQKQLNELALFYGVR